MISDYRWSVALAGFALIGIVAPVLSGGPPPDVIRFEGTAGKPLESPGVYPRVYSGQVDFQHRKHSTTYEVTCGDCHHADDFKPDADLVADVEITPCEMCHEEPGLVYGRKVDELDDDDVLLRRANALHRLCRGCHETHSARRQAIVAPIACRGCHAQRQADYTLIEGAGAGP